MDDDLVAVLVDAGGVAAEDHRQGVLAEADAPQRPQVVVVQRRRADLDRGPAALGLRIRALADLEAAERILAIETGGEHGAHGPQSCLTACASARPADARAGARPGANVRMLSWPP